MVSKKSSKRTRLKPTAKATSAQRPASAAVAVSSSEQRRQWVKNLRDGAAQQTIDKRKTELVRKQELYEYKQWLKKPFPPLAQMQPLVATAMPAKNLKILSEGDSWFNYPLPLLWGDGVIVQLKKLLGYPILNNLSQPGLEVEQMLGLERREAFISSITQGINFDAILFSGGGDDIVGDQFVLWLKDYVAGAAPVDCFDPARLASVLGMIEAGYRDLISLRDIYQPNAVIFVYAYDFPKVTGRSLRQGAVDKAVDGISRNKRSSDPRLGDEIVTAKFGKHVAKLGDP